MTREYYWALALLLEFPIVLYIGYKIGYYTERKQINPTTDEYIPLVEMDDLDELLGEAQEGGEI